jgi:hypothetical protein
MTSGAEPAENSKTESRPKGRLFCCLFGRVPRAAGGKLIEALKKERKKQEN